MVRNKKKKYVRRLRLIIKSRKLLGGAVKTIHKPQSLQLVPMPGFELDTACMNVRSVTASVILLAFLWNN
jgi:hypothetical protein